MGVDLVWRDETGRARETVADEQSIISTTIERAQAESRSVALVGRIDLYGDTPFSPSQIPQLIREFQVLRDALTDAGERVVIAHVIAVLHSADAIGDGSIEFIGD